MKKIFSFDVTAHFLLPPVVLSLPEEGCKLLTLIISRPQNHYFRGPRRIVGAFPSLRHLLRDVPIFFPTPPPPP